MSENDEKSDEAINALTVEEQRVLIQAIKQVERKLLEQTIKMIRNWIILAVGVLTVFGVISFVGIKATIVDQAAIRLSEDSQVKEDVVLRSIEKLETATNVLDRAKKLAKDIDVESSRISAGLSTQLGEIHTMIDQIRADLQKISDPSQGEEEP